MIYDTGAQITTMSRELANRLQINYLRTTNYRDDFIGGVGGTRTPVKVLLVSVLKNSYVYSLAN
eukprot:COSAG02_NODE_7318_length_3065_cov_3.301079_2_plen_64_part_00